MSLNTAHSLSDSIVAKFDDMSPSDAHIIFTLSVAVITSAETQTDSPCNNVAHYN